jgi:hypothetical protein
MLTSLAITSISCGIIYKGVQLNNSAIERKRVIEQNISKIPVFDSEVYDKFKSLSEGDNAILKLKIGDYNTDSRNVSGDLFVKIQQEKVAIIPAHSTHTQNTVIRNGIETTIDTIIHHPEVRIPTIHNIGTCINLTPFKESSFPILPSSQNTKHIPSAYDQSTKTANRTGEDISLSLQHTVPKLRLNPKSSYTIETVPGGETYFLGKKIGSQFIFNLEGRSSENIKNAHIIDEQNNILDLSTPAYIVGTFGIVGAVLYGISNSGKLF